MSLKIISWNINSIRARLSHLKKILHTYNPDLICLQETKVTNEKFPKEKIKSLGYEFFYLNGIPSYNGVSIISKIKADNSSIIEWCQNNDGRHISILLGKVTLHNIYIPAGGELPDPKLNQKFKHKLKFLDELISWSTSKTFKKTILCGDFNIAPSPEDVWSHKQLKNTISHTEIERRKLNDLQKSGFWSDIIKEKIKSTDNLFTWWSYRSKNFKINNRGRRLDHIWISEDLKKEIIGVKIIDYTREWEKPSDHVPIFVEIRF